MPRLEDLKQSLLSMNSEELRAKIRSIREDRVIRKDSAKAKVKKVREKTSAKIKVDKLLSGMSAEDIAAILKGLGE